MTEFIQAIEDTLNGEEQFDPGVIEGLFSEAETLYELDDDERQRLTYLKGQYQLKLTLVQRIKASIDFLERKRPEIDNYLITHGITIGVFGILLRDASIMNQLDNHIKERDYQIDTYACACVEDQPYMFHIDEPWCLAGTMDNKEGGKIIPGNSAYMLFGHNATTTFDEHQLEELLWCAAAYAVVGKEGRTVTDEMVTRGIVDAYLGDILRKDFVCFRAPMLKYERERELITADDFARYVTAVTENAKTEHTKAQIKVITDLVR